jgi:hypothetical protein
MAVLSTNRMQVARTDGIERVALRRLVWVGPLVVAAATAANEVARRIVLAVVPGVDPSYIALDASAVAMMTVLFTAAAVGVFAAVAKLSIQPIRTYQIVAVVALALSMLPDLMLLNEPSTTAGDVVALMILHVVAAAAVVWPLCTLTREA